MKKINIRKILEEKAPALLLKYPEFVVNLFINVLTGFLKVNEINKFLEQNLEKFNFDFIDGLFQELDFSYIVSSKDRIKIPSEGRLIIVSNHPLGGLDGLALLKSVSEVRNDVVVVANDILKNIDNLNDLFLSMDVYSTSKHKEHIKDIEKALNDEKAVIFFPSGKVSRLRMNGINDAKWQNGAIKFSSKLNVPILPAFIKGRNSLLFYLASLINSRIGMFMLPQELFRQKGRSIEIKFGDVIPAGSFKNNNLKPKIQSKLLQQHCQKIGKDKPGIFYTEKTIIHPINKKILKSELNVSILLGYTNDGMKIYLAEYETGPNIIKEIGRLRELTFRKVGEGTGKTIDMDIYDLYYKHIVLWDDKELEIVGSYRLGIVSEIIENYGPKGLYNSSQYKLSSTFVDKIKNSLEVGRSFIQQKYWKSSALDYIWQGIGAYLSKNDKIEYLWGAVSISDTYPEIAKNLIISYYTKWYKGDFELVTPCLAFSQSSKLQNEVKEILCADNYIDDFKNLKNALKNMGLSVPVLYRRYTELAEYGGAKFISWCIDVNFNNAIDGLIVVDLSMLKEEVKERYYRQKSFVGNQQIHNREQVSIN
ncbi:lysophospholipid acyltransferase family protein [Candidatus Kapaibacterium sp.]